MGDRNTFLKINRLYKSFGALMAVNDVNIEVHQGEITAIIGPNGAGKTTLFNLITSTLHPDSGEVLFKGEDLTKLSTDKIVRKGIGRSFQIVNIYPDLTVLDSIQITLLAGKRKTYNIFSSTKDLYREETERILEKVGLSEFSDVTGGLLSHGDRKRLETAMLLANEAELILLDEPTAGMAPEETGATMSLFRDLVEKENLTMLFTEHDMKVVFDYASRIAVMCQGRIIADGTPEEIKQHPEVREVYLGEKI